MFASFWNRNHAIRTLQRSAKNYHSMIEAEKKVYLAPKEFCTSRNFDPFT